MTRPTGQSDAPGRRRAIGVTPAPNRWTTDVEIERSKELTRANTQRTIRHHYVPQVYLKRWSPSGDALVRVVDLANKSAEDVDPSSVAYAENFYEIEAPDIDPDGHPSMWFETHMSRIEDKAARWFAALDGLPDGRIKNTNLLSNLAVYIGLQSQRTVRSRDNEEWIDRAIEHYGAEALFDIPGVLPVLAANYRIRYTPATHQEVAQQIIGTKLVSAERKPKTIESAIGLWRNKIVPHLEHERSWWLSSTPTPLITCDEPVVLIGTKRQPRNRPVPFTTAPLILFPIGPQRLLVLALRDRTVGRPHALTAAETTYVNREIAFNSNALLFDTPGSTVAEGVAVPPYPPARTGFPDTLANYAEFIDALSPLTRWTGASHWPQWPLPRWSSPPKTGRR